MAENTQLQEQKKKEVGPVQQVKMILNGENVRKRFSDVLGKKSPQFMASIVNVVSASTQLQACDANSIIAAAFVAASYDLPIDSNLGFSAIVPYNNKKYNPQTREWEKHMEAQFQLMYKGFVQLAIRSGYYEKMNYATIYEDELISYNPITGEAEFVTDFSNCTQRNEGLEDKVVGYYAWFKLNNGFRKELYMSRADVDNHARKYSKAYRYDISENKRTSKWSTDFEAMALKTVIKLLLSKWGILSVDMQRAIKDDQKTFDDEGNGDYGDNKPDVVEAEDPFKRTEDKSAADEPEELDITNITQQ